jgi:hypothetical protein
MILGHLLRDVLEPFDTHPKTPAKIVPEECQIFVELHPHQPIVAFDLFPPQLPSAKNRVDAL